MHEYRAPLADMKFVLRELVDLELLAQLPGFGEMTLDVADAVLEEAAKFAAGVLSPLNRSGDLEGARWQEGQVLTAGGWKQAYTRFAADGWNALSCPVELGGQNLPRALSALIGGAEGHVPPEDGQRGVGRDHEPHRASGRLRPVGGAYSSRAERRWPLPDNGPEDLHYLRRP